LETDVFKAPLEEFPEYSLRKDMKTLVD